jgi:hypothetical protein
MEKGYDPFGIPALNPLREAVTVKARELPALTGKLLGFDDFIYIQTKDGKLCFTPIRNVVSIQFPADQGKGASAGKVEDFKRRLKAS